MSWKKKNIHIFSLKTFELNSQLVPKLIVAFLTLSPLSQKMQNVSFRKLYMFDWTVNDVLTDMDENLNVYYIERSIS